MKKGLIILILLFGVVTASAVPAFASYKSDVELGSGNVTAVGSNKGPDVDLTVADYAVRGLISSLISYDVSKFFDANGIDSERPIQSYSVSDVASSNLKWILENMKKQVIAESFWHSKYSETDGKKYYDTLFFCGSASTLSEGASLDSVIGLRLELPSYSVGFDWLTLGKLDWSYGSALVEVKTVVKGGKTYTYKILSNYKENGKLKEVPLLDENGNPIFSDFDGTPRYKLVVN